jgi:multidrug efflux pump subunit AcrB
MRGEAILLAGQKRLRPIVMNTVTTIFGMLPMMIYPGTGAEFYRPLAVAVIFGLAFADGADAGGGAGGGVGDGEGFRE